MNETIKIFALGGLDEEGKSLIVLDLGGDLFVVGCGLKLPDKTQPGIDYIIPRYDFLKDNKARVKAYFLLHGHDDEIGALAFLYKDVPAPIYGSKVTLAMLKMFTKHAEKDPSIYDLHEVKATSDFLVAGRQVSFFHTAHNIADSSGIAVHTSRGNIVITGDFVVENTASPSYLHDMNALARIAEAPTLALLTESGYASRPGYTSPKYRLTPHIEETFKNAPGRIFVSLYSSNLFNFDETIRLAVFLRKKILCYDEATLNIVQTMQSCGQLLIPRENFASIDEIHRLRDQDIVVLVSGFGGRLFRKIALLASGENEDKRIAISPSDTFIFASPSDDNTELEYTDAIDTVYRTGCNVLNVPKKLFCKMHASEEDLKMMASILKPRYYIPVKGFYKDLLANGMVALSMGIGLTHASVFVIENGQSVIIDDTGARVFDEKIPHGDLMIDGATVGDISSAVLEDREKLAEGVVILALTISRSKHQIVAGPDVQMRGFVFMKEADMILRDVSHIFLSTVNDFLTDSNYNVDEIKQNVYEHCLRAIRRQTGKEPMIIPMIVEIA